MLRKLLNDSSFCGKKLTRKLRVWSESILGLAIIALTSISTMIPDRVIRLSFHIGMDFDSDAILYAASAYGLEYVMLSVTCSQPHR